jgi:signal transduction histidine kinase
MDWLEFFQRTPYSPPHLLGIIFLILGLIFLDVRRRTHDSYSLWLGIGMLFSTVAWGTADLQNVGQLYIDWKWWWAQPFFAVAIVSISIGVVNYLPLDYNFQKRLKRIAVWPPIAYISFVTLFLLLEFPMVRAWAVLSLLPSMCVIAYAAFAAEKIEPDKGHRLLGLTILVVPLLGIIFPVLGLKTAVSRFWTAIPLLILSISILSVSLLREREKIQQHLEQLFAAESQLIALNQDLETRVQDRTVMLNEVISDLESFNRNVSHDIRSPLGSIAMLAYTAKKLLEAGKVDLANENLQLIKEQVEASQSMVTTMLDLASAVDKTKQLKPVDLSKLTQKRLELSINNLKRKNPNAPLPAYELIDLGVLNTDEVLVRIILDNLIENAIKFNSEKTDLKIRIGLITREGAPCVYVQDNGVGYNAANLHENIFDPYQRLGTQANTAGYGLGLSIVKRAVSRLGGETFSESLPGQGASFYFTLPQPTTQRKSA